MGSRLLKIMMMIVDHVFELAALTVVIQLLINRSQRVFL